MKRKKGLPESSEFESVPDDELDEFGNSAGDDELFEDDELDEDDEFEDEEDFDDDFEEGDYGEDDEELEELDEEPER